MWLAETHYSVGDAFPVVIVPEVVLLLAEHPRDDFQITFLSDSQQVFCIPIVPLDLTYLLQYLAEQVTQPACNLPRLAPAMLAVSCMSSPPSARQGTLSGDGGVSVCRSARTSSHSSSRSLPTAASCLSDNASRSHSTSHLCTSCPVSPCTVSTCRRVCPGDLYLQLPCKFHHYVVQQLVVRHWPCRIYYHVAEYLVVDVAVQLFQ